MAKSIKGGRIWPHKYFLYDQPIGDIPQPASLAIPLWHGGKPSVKKGEQVAAGAVVGHDHNGLPVFTALSGKVTDIGDFPHLVARPKTFDFARTTVFIDVSPEQEPAGPVFTPQPRFWELSKSELTERLFQAGVMDLRDSELPRHLIFDGLDTEPPLSCNIRLLTERPREIILGMRIIMQLHGSEKARLVLSPGMKELNGSMKSLLASAINISILQAEPKYPQQRPRLLKHTVFPGREAAIYCMEDLLWIKQAVVDGSPLTSKCCTLRNDLKAWQKTALIPVGTSAAQALGLDLLEYRNLRMVMGGLLSGSAYYSPEMPVSRDTGGVLLLREHLSAGQQACISCGQCLKVCPAGLAPSHIYRLVRDVRREALPGTGLQECLECGLCTYVCPSGLLLSSQIKVGKLMMEEKL
jgi:electron transport complex protein RnfC